MRNVVAIYVAALKRVVDQLTFGSGPDEIAAAAADLRLLDPFHPALPALDERAQAARGPLTPH